MFELLATVDPFAALLGSLWLFAAGMFPLGFMLGSTCSACCGEEPCSACTQGSLPETITATLDGFTDYEKQYLTNLTFSACYGSGAAGRVETPGHVTPGTDPIPDRGPVGSVSLSNGGSGYAKLGRTAPTVTVTGTSGSGSGATFNVTLASSKDSCGLDRWAVSKVTRTGGSGYQIGDTLTFAIAEGDTQEVAAQASIGLNYSEPTLTLTAPGGTGGVLTVSGYSKYTDSSNAGYWGIAGVTVTSGGSGYTDNAQVSVTLGAGDEARPNRVEPDIRIRTAIDPPADEWTLTSYSQNGSGLVVSLTLERGEDIAGYGPIFLATSATVVNGGTGYAVDDAIYAEGSTTLEGNPCGAVVSSVDGNGAVTGLDVIYTGYHEGVDTGVIDSVEFANGPFGTPPSHGAYRKLATVPTYAAPTLTATVSGGTGGVLSINGYAEVVGGFFIGYYVPTGISVVSGGSGYTNNAPVTLSLGTNDEWADGSGEPDITIRTGFRAPNDSWTLQPGSPSPTGTGLVVSLTLAAHPTATNTWWVSSWSITNGGTGYAVGQVIRPLANEGNNAQSPLRAALVITAVNANGAATSLDLLGTSTTTRNTSRGRYAIDTGVITSVVISSNRASRKAVAQDVIVSNGGVYYREDASLPPYVATVTVGVNQTAPSQGSGASISATVGSDPANAETFGKITGLAVDGGGDGYLAWEWKTNDCCGHYLNGKSIVLKRVPVSNSAICNLATVDFTPGNQYLSVSSSCVYAHRFCGGWVEPFLFGPVWDRSPQGRALQLYVGFTGEGQPAVAKLVRACGAVSSDDNTPAGCVQEWISDAVIDNCQNFQWSKTNANGLSISVTQSGSYDPEWRFAGCESTASASCQSCNVCCQGDGDVPEEIEVVVTDEWTTNRPSGMPNFAGTYVATGGPNFWEFGGAPPGFEAVFGSFGINPCHDGTMNIYVTGPRGSCETCIKKCRVWISGMTFQWYEQVAQTSVFIQRRIAQLPPTDECADCDDTPVCSPSGKSFSLNRADPAMVGYAYGEHAATVTIQ